MNSWTRLHAFSAAAICVVIGIAGCGTKTSDSINYKVVLPQNLPAGYALIGEVKPGADVLKELFGERQLTLVRARYAARTSMTIVAGWGHVEDPAKVPATVLAKLDSAPDTDLVGGTFSPSSPQYAGAVITCRMHKFDTEQPEAVAPLCVWSDRSTVGIISFVGTQLTLQTGADLVGEMRAVIVVKGP